ncbi:nicotinate phosphoribosyltransferase [Vibrio sp. UCD-FRSSP16_10]|nr:nicotinate phosphoribosyltransferase [Vibrio sp. UCD-FRSSP16_30]OBT22917.1 nicotinate phosphoribosyltransferase [Vibrio sp. UCD-FRSSP16_10]
MKEVRMLRYSAKYFDKTSKIVKKHRPNSVVTLQFFQRVDNSILGGLNESLELLKKQTDTSKYAIKHRSEGDLINKGDIVLELEGHYSDFGEYEGIIDGILSRSTSLATNAYRVMQVANGKDVIFMGDRADHYLNQELDGYAIALGGIQTQVTDAHVSQHTGKAVGTVPHALIQMFEGDLVAALHAYQDTFPDEALSALVDFNNDVITDSLKALEAFGQDLVSIRVDTSGNMSDAMFVNDEEFGVTPLMIKSLREALDKHQGQHVKIIVSSGFDIDKIVLFEKEKTPVDVYGVGASLLKINNTFTADAVRINGKEIAKVGRGYKPF